MQIFINIERQEAFYNKGLNIDKNNLHIMNNLANLKKDLDKVMKR